MLAAIESADNVVLLEAEVTAVLAGNGKVEVSRRPEAALSRAEGHSDARHVSQRAHAYRGRELSRRARGEPPSCRLAGAAGLPGGSSAAGSRRARRPGSRGAASISRAAMSRPGTRSHPFSFRTKEIQGEQVPCHITYTRMRGRTISFAGIWADPHSMPGGSRASAPRYCPSIEDKVVRFPDRERHQIFLEPEGRESAEIYINGLSTSLPRDVQEEMIHSIAGSRTPRSFDTAMRSEYDYYPPHQVFATLESRRIGGLFRRPGKRHLWVRRRRRRAHGRHQRRSEPRGQGPSSFSEGTRRMSEFS